MTYPDVCSDQDFNMVIACATRDKYDARLWLFKYINVHVPLQAKGNYQPEGSVSRKYVENSWRRMRQGDAISNWDGAVSGCMSLSIERIIEAWSTLGG